MSRLGAFARARYIALLLLALCSIAALAANAQYITVTASSGPSIAPNMIALQGQPFTVSYGASPCGQCNTLIEMDPVSATGSSACQYPINPDGSLSIPLCSSQDTTFCAVSYSTSGANPLTSGTQYLNSPGFYEYCGYNVIVSGVTFSANLQGSPPSSGAINTVTVNFGTTVGTVTTGAAQVIPGASTNITFTVQNVIQSQGQSPTQNCAYGFCMVLLQQPVYAECPGSISTLPLCSATAPTTLPCFLTPNTLPLSTTVQQTPVNVLVYLTPNTIPPSANPYEACGYYSTSSSGASATFVGSTEFSVNAIGSSYGLVSYFTPTTFSLGDAPIASFQGGSNFYSFTGNTNVCTSGATCILEFSTQSSGCVSPENSIPPPSCGTSAPVSPPCILDAYPPLPYGSNGGLFYQQPLNTQYLASGNYLVCGYDYMQTFSGPSSAQVPAVNVVSPFFSTIVFSCNSIACDSYSLYPPASVIPPPPPPTVSNALIATANIPFGALASITCNLYTSINVAFLLLALVIMLLGAVMYAGSSALPGAFRGTVRGYAVGFLLVGVVATVVSSLSIWLIAVATGNTVAGVMSLCA